MVLAAQGGSAVQLQATMRHCGRLYYGGKRARRAVGRCCDGTRCPAMLRHEDGRRTGGKPSAAEGHR
ncbi:unnamed protein product [Musa acuminata var. zebrina]